MTADEIRRVEQIGFTKIADGRRVPPDVLVARGNLKALNRSWIAVLPSKTPEARELGALQRVADELSRSVTPTTVGLIHTSRASEEIAKIFADRGVDTVMLLPFGIFTRKSMVRKSSGEDNKTITVVSTAQPDARWGRELFAQTSEILREHTSVALISEPRPHWFATRGRSFWRQHQIFYLRYDDLTEDMRDALTAIGATGIGRAPDTGNPNLDKLLALHSKATFEVDFPHSDVSDHTASLADNRVDEQIELFKKRDS